MKREGMIVMANRIGQQVGKYRLTRLLGKGGFAEVYLGTHIHLGSQAAVKLLLAQLASSGEVEQFRREAQTIAALRHPHIVRVLDFDVEDGTPYLLMDYAPGGSLRQRVPAGVPLAPAAIVPLLGQVADALQSAHEQKLVHRDIKPENMLVGERNEVLLSDFGIATAAQSTSQQKTQGVAGTAAYMSPEQLQGKPRPTSDLYALGVVVYEWLAGERPFQGSFTEVASQHLFTPPPPVRDKVPGTPAAVEQVVLTALAKDPKERFGSVRAFAHAFAQASGVSASQFALPGILPVSADQPTLAQRSQDEGGLSRLATRLTTPPERQRVQAGPSILDAPTQLTPPTAVTAPAAEHTEMPSGAPAFPRDPEQDSARASYPASQTSGPPPLVGWGGQTPPEVLLPAGPNQPNAAESVLATQESAYGPAGKRSPEGEAPPVGKAPPGRLALPQDSFGRLKGGMRRVSLLAAACLVVLVLLFGGAVYAVPRLFSSHAGSSSTTGSSRPTAAGPATVTITPESLDLKNSYTLTAVTGTPDASKQQVGARVISVTTPAVSKTVQATGQKTTPGTHASGMLEVANYDTLNPLKIPAGSTFPNNTPLSCGSSSLIIVLDAPATLPAVPPPGNNYPKVLVPGHVQQVGTSGNAQPSSCFAFIYHNVSNCPGTTYGNVCWAIAAGSVTIPLTGGTDPQPYTAVAQSDIDGAANSLINANQPDAQQVVQGQVQSNEQLIGTPQCSPNTSADHKAGDAASQVTVMVTFTCIGEAYDHDAALALASTLLTNQARSSPGAGYALVGQIKTTLTNATLGSQGTVTITATAEGVWSYQFSDAQKQSLAGLIAGKSEREAIQVLQAQTGVAQVAIHFSGGNGQTLPTDPRQITITIQDVQGA
jgi:VCBS repeat-containing protein